MTTARLSRHARERCAEMGVRTKRVKRIVRDPDLDYCSRNAAFENARIASRADDPTIAVVYVYASDGRPLVVTVVWRTQVRYARDGCGFIDLTTTDERTTLDAV